MSQIAKELRHAYVVRDIPDWGLLNDAADEIDRLRSTLKIIAGSSDRLQAAQAIGVLDNIGAKP